MFFIFNSEESGKRYEGALQVLFENNYERVYKTIRAITLDAELAKDVTQEALLAQRQTSIQVMLLGFEITFIGGLISIWTYMDNIKVLVLNLEHIVGCTLMEMVMIHVLRQILLTHLNL